MSNGQRIADETLNKIKGTIYGQAIGDALGLGTEGMTDEDMAWKYPNGISRGNRCLSYKLSYIKMRNYFSTVPHLFWHINMLLILVANGTVSKSSPINTTTIYILQLFH